MRNPSLKLVCWYVNYKFVAVIFKNSEHILTLDGFTCNKHSDIDQKLFISLDEDNRNFIVGSVKGSKSTEFDKWCYYKIDTTSEDKKVWQYYPDKEYNLDRLWYEVSDILCSK